MRLKPLPLFIGLAILTGCATTTPKHREEVTTKTSAPVKFYNATSQLQLQVYCTLKAYVTGNTHWNNPLMNKVCAMPWQVKQRRNRLKPNGKRWPG